MSEQPISEARLAANRANAQHSTGPLTPETKAKVSLNAVKTALTGRTVLLPSDDAAKYQTLLQNFQSELQPVGVQELALVQSIVDCRWRLDRIPSLEMALLSLIRREWVEENRMADSDSLLAVIEMDMRRANQKEFRNLQLQESRLARRCEKDMAELRRLQQERKAKEGEQLEKATEACLVAKHNNLPFNLADLGFEFTTQRFEAHLASLSAARKQQILDQALKAVAQTQRSAA
jgi:hypothetical protein